MAQKKGKARNTRLRTLITMDARETLGKEDVRMILSHHVSAGLSPQDIADRYESNISTIRTWLQKFNIIPKSTRPNVTQRLQRLGYATWDEFFRKNMSMTHMDAAKMLNCHWTTVSHYRRLWVGGRKI